MYLTLLSGYKMVNARYIAVNYRNKIAKSIDILLKYMYIADKSRNNIDMSRACIINTLYIVSKSWYMVNKSRYNVDTSQNTVAMFCACTSMYMYIATVIFVFL